MRLGPTGAVVVLAAALLAGCAAGPEGTQRPSAANTPSGASISPSADPSASPSPSRFEPAASGPAGSPAIRVPLVLEATGRTAAAIAGGGLLFAPKLGGGASCRSHADGTAVSDVTALELGELGPGTLRAMWSVPARDGRGAVELFIDGGDLPDHSFPPFWTGRVVVAALAGDGASGSISFAALELERDPAGKPGLPAPGGADAWPTTLSGRLSWTCDAWVAPTASGAISTAP